MEHKTIHKWKNVRQLSVCSEVDILALQLKLYGTQVS